MGAVAFEESESFVSRMLQRDLDTEAWYIDVPEIDFADEVDAELMDDCLIIWSSRQTRR
ncbi:MAG: hypothetical protein RIM72_22710 [Alphaproteobacteria bacterium]